MTSSAVSSTAPGIVENSCRTSSILTPQTAAPSRDDSSTRRSALPSVRPKPRSNGCTWNSPCLSLSDSGFFSTRLGRMKFSRAIPSSVISSNSRRARPTGPALLRIQLHDQLLLGRDRDRFPARHLDHAARLGLEIDFQPRQDGFLPAALDRPEDQRHLAALLLDLDLLARRHLVRGNVHHTAVDYD